MVINNPEHLEAYQQEANKKLEEFAETLPDNQKLAMQKIGDVIGECEQANIPIVTLAIFKERCYQWNSLKNDKNSHLDKYNPKEQREYTKVVWDTIAPKMLHCFFWLFSQIYCCKFKVFSLIDKKLIAEYPPQTLEDNNKLD